MPEVTWNGRLIVSSSRDSGRKRLCRWVIRLARTLYEVPRGLDLRLVERSSNWEKETQEKYAFYLKRAEQEIIL